MRVRQVNCLAVTPKKCLKRVHVSYNKDENTSIKDFLPPIVENMVVNLSAFTPLKKQPQYLLSPSPIKKDLFSLLLGSELKHGSPCLSNINSNNMIMQEQDYADDQSNKQNNPDNNNYKNKKNNNNNNQDNNDDDDESGSLCSDSQNGWDDENGIKKRKRKSTVQIKILKQQLDGEMNWTKDKIVKMAEVTGLSQSQVYKWCWDQKKKNIKNKQGHKRKFIRKDYTLRNDQDEMAHFEKLSGKFHQYEFEQAQVRTKPKLVAMLQESEILTTEKKVNKKLVFH